MHCDDEGRWVGLRVSLFSLSFVSICKKVFEHTVNTFDMPVIYINVLSLISGSDIVQWMIKNLDIEDPGKRAHQHQSKVVRYCSLAADLLLF